MTDFLIQLPWINRRRPFVALHISSFPGFRVHYGKTRKYYRCGLIWGRQFMPTKSGSSWWFDVVIPSWCKWL